MFIFILNWSEFMFALVLSYTDVITIPVQLAKYVTATARHALRRPGGAGGAGHAALVIGGFLIQSHLARGMTFGAVKR